MARRPPEIVSAIPNQVGGLRVEWRVDQFYSDSEPGEKVLIEVNGILEATLDGTESSYDIAKDTIQRFRLQRIPSLTVGIIFWWGDGSAAEEQQSVITVSLGAQPPPALEQPQERQWMVPPRNLRVTGYNKHHSTLVWDNGQYYSKILVNWRLKTNMLAEQVELAGRARTVDISEIIPNSDYIIGVKGGLQRWLFGIAGYTYSEWACLDWTPLLDTCSVRAVLAFRGIPADAGIRVAVGSGGSVSRWLAEE
jgi:hypothetical protein